MIAVLLTPLDEFLLSAHYQHKLVCYGTNTQIACILVSGRIVLVSSQAGQTGVYGYTAYSATKFALRGFAESLQMEVRFYTL